MLTVAAVLIIVHGLGGGGRTLVAPRVVAQPPKPRGGVYPPHGAAPLRLHLDDAPAFVLAFHHPPRAGLAFDLDDGRVLWQRNALRPEPMASLAKMMTALLVVRSAPADAKVRVTREALAYQGSGVGVLPKGKDVRLETLLAGLLLPSGNDAAIALAQHVAGSVPEFIVRMNAMARRMGLQCTHYTSVDGFADSARTCASDLAVLARADLDQPRIAALTRRRLVVAPLPIKGGKVYLYNNNPLIRAGYPGVTGLKTGETVAAGLCLVGTVEAGGHRVGVVILGARTPAQYHAMAIKLMDRAVAADRA